MTKKAGPAKRLTSVRISADAKTLLEGVAAKLAISQSAVLELAIRRMAEVEKVGLPAAEKPQ